MSSCPSPSPSVASGPASPTNPDSAQASSPLITAERLSLWGLPLLALSVLLGAVGMALRLGQVQWTTAGIAVYVVCLAMWLAATIVREPSATAAPTSSGRVVRPDFQAFSESHLFVRIANWFFPVVGIVVLTASSYLGAVTRQQSWLTVGAINFSGCFLVWAGKLFVPLGLRRTATPLPNYVPQNPMALIAMLLLPFLNLGLVLLCATNVLRMPWIGLAIVSFCAYLIVASERSVRVDVQWQPVDLVWVVIPAAVLGILTAGLGLGVYFYHMSWVIAGIVGSIGCVAVWLVQIVQVTRKNVPQGVLQSTSQIGVPAVLLTGLLAFLMFALYQRELSALKAALLALLGGLALWFSWMFVLSVEKDGPPKIESNWAGLGGSVGGWRCSASLVYALCALILVVCTSFAFVEVQRSSVPQINQSKK